MRRSFQVMLPLSEFKKRGYENIRYPKADNGNEMRSIVLANRKKNDSNWYDEENMYLGVTLVPEDIIEDVKNNLYRRPFNRSLMEDSSRREQARQEVFSAVVIGIIEAAPSIYKEDKDTVVFEDMLVCRPIDANLSDLRVYVPHRKAGMFQTMDLRNMIDRIVPLKIVDLKERHYSKFQMPLGVKNNYAALGDIDIAELLMNSEAIEIARTQIKENEGGSFYQRMEQRKKALEERTQNGIISYVNQSGVYVLDENLRSYKIPKKRFGYGAFSKIHPLEYYAEVGKQIKFNFVGWKKGKSSKIETEESNSFSPSDFTSEEFILWGSSIELETSPTDRLKTLIDDSMLVGSVHTAYLVTYDVVRGHLIELEGFPGVTVKLRNTERLDKTLVYTHKPLSVVVKRARYRKLEDNQIIFYVHCEFNTDMRNAERSVSLNGFFKR